MTPTVRLISRHDIPALTELLIDNREFLAPWEPSRAEEFFTTDYQETAAAEALAEYHQGRMLPLVIVDDDALVGRVTLNNILRGPLQSAKIGSWVAKTAGGRGVATAALAAVVPIAFGELGLHRLSAATLLHNVRSQRVLERSGFVRFGVAARYLKIAGTWQDHALYQRLSDDA